MEKSQNYVELWGTAGAAPSFSHENHGESFYRFPLRVERLSGQSDLPLILAPSALLEGIDIAEGTPLRVTGQLRSFNNRSGHGGQPPLRARGLSALHRVGKGRRQDRRNAGGRPPDA